MTSSTDRLPAADRTIIWARAGLSGLPRFYAPADLVFSVAAERELLAADDPYRVELVSPGPRFLLHCVTRGEDAHPTVYVEPALPGAEGDGTGFGPYDIGRSRSALERIAAAVTLLFTGTILEVVLRASGHLELVDVPYLAGEDERMSPWSRRRELLTSIAGAGPVFTTLLLPERISLASPVSPTGARARIVRTGSPYRSRRRRRR